MCCMSTEKDTPPQQYKTPKGASPKPSLKCVRRSGRNVLGRGTQGVVEKHIIDDKEYAVKFTYAYKELLKKEANILEKLKGTPGMLQFDSFCEENDDGEAALITELVKGMPIAKLTYFKIINFLLLQRQPIYGVLQKRMMHDVHEAERVMIELLQCVIDLHKKNIFHGDLHIENIMLKKGKDAKDHPVFIDFGYACETDESPATCTRKVPYKEYGAYRYYDFRLIDVQMLGTTLLSLMTGEFVELPLYLWPLMGPGSNKPKWVFAHPTVTLRPAAHTGIRWDRIYYVIQRMMGIYNVCKPEEALEYMKKPIPSVIPPVIPSEVSSEES